MAISFACPGCAAPFKVADTMAGKKAKCPKCQVVFVVPVGADDEAVAVALADEAPPKVKEPARGKGHEVQAEAPRPATKGRATRATEPEEADPKPRRRDDEEDDRPTRRRTSARKRGAPAAWVWFVGAGALILFLVCGGGVTAIVALALTDAPAHHDVHFAHAPPVAFMPPPVLNMPMGGGNQPATRVNLGNGVFQTRTQLTQQDPIDPEDPDCRCKRFLVQLQAGKTYTIDHEAPGFDAFLRVEETTGAQLAEDDDGGAGLNSSLQFRPTRTGDYVVVATSLAPGFGPFTLTIRESHLPKPR